MQIFCGSFYLHFSCILYAAPRKYFEEDINAYGFVHLEYINLNLVLATHVEHASSKLKIQK